MVYVNIVWPIGLRTQTRKDDLRIEPIKKALKVLEVVARVQ